MTERLRSITTPIALLALCLLSFGLLIPSLGFYWDDWPSLLIHSLQGPDGFREFFAIDRPTTFVSYVLLMPVFDSSPLLWHLFTLLLRWGCAVLVWQLVRQIWSGAETVAVWSALIFAIHPVFRQQPIALTYHQLWMEYVFFLFSLVGMVLAIRQPRRALLWTILALVGLALNLLISEYFLGVELLRLLILFLALPRQNWLLRLRRAFVRYLPFLALLLVYLAWRFVLIDLPGEDRNAPTLLLNWLANPLPVTVQLAQMVLQDASHILAAAWYPTFGPQIFDLSGRFNLFTLGLSVLAAAGTAVFLWKRRDEDGAAAPAAAGASSALLLGLLIVFIGPLPGWVTERQVIVGAWSDRLAVPAMLGASMALAGLIAWIARGRLQGILLVSLLVGLAAGSHLRNANDYRWATVQQNRFFWQLYWRAPEIARGTALFAEAEVLPKTGLYSTAMGVNMIYGKQGEGNALPYWFFSLSREYGHRMNELTGGMTLENGLRQWTFTGNSGDSLIVYYDPGEADCLRLLTAQDGGDPALSALEVSALPVVNLERVGTTPVDPPDPYIFGPEPPREWCYIFQKADLARQIGDWQTVVALGDGAMEIGFTMENSQSNTPQEWIPFIQGYAHTGNIDQAVRLSRQALERQPKLAPMLCSVWDGLRTDIPTARNDPGVGSLWNDIGCGQ